LSRVKEDNKRDEKTLLPRKNIVSNGNSGKEGGYIVTLLFVWRRRKAKQSVVEDRREPWIGLKKAGRRGMAG